MQIPSMPFKVLAMAPFQLSAETHWDAGPVIVDLIAIDDAMASLDVSAYIPIPSELCPAGGLDLRFRKLKDFHPDGLVQNNPFLSRLAEARQFLSEAGKKRLSKSEIQAGMKQWPDLPEIRVSAGQAASLKTPSPKTKSNEAIDKILNMVAVPDSSPPASVSIPSGVEQIDAIAATVLNHIFEDHGFRAAESAWRGLKLLMQQTPSESRDVVFEIVPATINSLDALLSSLTAGLIDRLPSLIIIDLSFDNAPFSTGLLERIASFSETLMVPAVVQISPKFLQLETWNDIKRLSFIPHYLEQPEFGKWQALKHQPAANWLAACCNRFLVRYPYGDKNLPRKFVFSEAHLPWTGAVWAIAGLIVQSFTKNGWPTRFTDWQKFRIENLALHSHAVSGEIPTETIFDNDRMEQLASAGIMSLAAVKNKDIAFLPHETVVTGVSLAYQLLAARITQFIIWCKDHFPENLSAQDVENRLKQAFFQLWEITGHSNPEILEITAKKSDSDVRIALHIELQPSCEILPNGESIIMDFFW